MAENNEDRNPNSAKAAEGAKKAAEGANKAGKKTLKKLWKKIPITVRLKIYGIALIVVVVALVFFCSGSIYKRLVFL